MQVYKNYEDTVFWIEQIIDYFINDKPIDGLSPNELKVYNHVTKEHYHTLYYIQDRISKTKYMDEWLKPLKELAEKTILELDINYIKEIRGEDLASIRPLPSAIGFDLYRGNANKDKESEKSITEKTLDQLFREIQTLTSGLHREIFLLKSEKTAMDKFVVTLQDLNNSINRDLYSVTGKTESLTKDKTELQGHNKALNKLVLELKASNEILDLQVKHIISKDVKESVEDGVKIFITEKEYNKELDLIIGLLFHYLRDRCYTQLTGTECDILNFIKANFQDSLYELRLLDKCVIEDLEANASIFKKIRLRYMKSLAKDVSVRIILRKKQNVNS